jgi:hypothetical protein
MRTSSKIIVILALIAALALVLAGGAAYRQQRAAQEMRALTHQVQTLRLQLAGLEAEARVGWERMADILLAMLVLAEPLCISKNM